VHVSSRDADDVPEYFAMLESQLWNEFNINLQVPTWLLISLISVHFIIDDSYY